MTHMSLAQSSGYFNSRGCFPLLFGSGYRSEDLILLGVADHYQMPGVAL
jgi:hypothetical protein